MYAKVLVILSFFLLIQYMNANPELDDRIVGGKPANIFSHPYQLSLQYNKEHICGASLISFNTALTAAHCVDSYYHTPSLLTVYAGSTYVNRDGIRLSLLSIISHRFYNSITWDNDIAILKLQGTLSLGPNILPVALISKNEEVPTNTVAVVTGWGTLREGGTTVLALRSVALPIVDNKTCRYLYRYKGIVNNRMLCAGFSTGNFDSCQGDSGGPLVANGKLIGIVSWGYGCARPSYPGVYTKVSAFRDWIYNEIHI